MADPGPGIPDSDRVVEALRASGALERLRTLSIETLEHDVRRRAGSASAASGRAHLPT